MEWNHGMKNGMEWRMYTTRVTSAVQCYASYYVSRALITLTTITEDFYY